ncbi:uncharacterized protein LOC724555 [Apis mellifera]|uniref:Uncharacterized protein LOC724555 n=1 Tax=Apis mellifera TaxID=7460 RepID=A0A7M7MK54_APIME|nr:uncharacterized protein LOC724555 [Apis mellifera]|eukprot:XP_026295090.1 uncharacterized protein LOC724555 [Apis mellifera]
MNSETITWILIVYSVCALESCYSLDYNGAKIVTYGEPCVTSRRLPFQIEGPKSPQKEEKIPVSLNFKMIPDTYIQPHRIEYPISLDIPCSTSSPSEKKYVEDTLRGKVYAYNTYIPPVNSPPSPSVKNYNFKIENVPITTKNNYNSECEMKQVQRLKGLQSRIDRILVPACEVSSLPLSSSSSLSSSLSSSCQCQKFNN